MKIGGLFEGYGGLTMATQAVIGGTVAWHSEIDPAASKILTHHWPTVPNLGDITKVDWTRVEPVDVITGGSPCQDVSAAGKRAGMKAGTRSGLWASMVDAIDALRPRLVVWENVRGVTSAEADSGLEPCAGCVGDRDDGAVLRALGRVLGDLSDLGYDSRWCGLRAADVGAPHGRFRIFVAATDTANVGRERRWPARDGWTGSADGHRSATDTCSDGCERRAQCNGGQVRSELETSQRHDIDGRPVADTSCDSRRITHGNNGTPANPASDGRHEGWTESAGIIGGSDAALSSATPTDTDSNALRQQPVAEPWRSGQTIAGQSRSDAAPDSERCGRDGRTRDPQRRPEARTAVAWGSYEPAIRRWERTLGRVAPAPTELAPKGGQRLSPAFVEWMQGLPAGHVTDPAIGISRNDQLKALGNGVVPQQAAAALRFLLRTKTGEVAA